MVVIGITKKPETGEYRVFWKENGKDNEAKAYYTDDPQDAVNSLLSILERQEGIWPTKVVHVSDARTTQNLLGKYEPEWSQRRG